MMCSAVQCSAVQCSAVHVDQNNILKRDIIFLRSEDIGHYEVEVEIKMSLL